LEEKEWYTVEDIYEYLDKSTPIDSIRQWIRDKRLKATRPGRQWLVRRADLEKFLEDNQNIPDKE